MRLLMHLVKEEPVMVIVDLAGSHARVVDASQECLAGPTEAEKAMILGENARRFYGIA
jgi:predicted TIM-barrel fold metal-dependent hydrolase